jgi:hypothetical protein
MEVLTIIHIPIYYQERNVLKYYLEVKHMAAENNGKQEPSPTLTEKITTVIIICYLIALIWLTGSQHWLGIW